MADGAIAAGIGHLASGAATAPPPWPEIAALAALRRDDAIAALLATASSDRPSPLRDAVAPHLAATRDPRADAWTER